MIRIRKPRRAPDILATTGKEKALELCSRFDESQEDYRNGSKRFTFSLRIYGHESVKQALIAAQHGKCCYCEQLVDEDGDVEHFRPKGGVQQAKRTRIETPGYFWLAYEWTNLLLSCSGCNQRAKGNLFPLQNPKSRAVSPRHPISRERPLFINPATTDPTKHITFLDWKAVPVNDSPVGKKTADILLNRRLLKVRRERWLRILSDHYDTLIVRAAMHGKRNVLASAKKELLKKYANPKMEFSALTRAALETDFFRQS